MLHTMYQNKDAHSETQRVPNLSAMFEAHAVPRTAGPGTPAPWPVRPPEEVAPVCPRKPQITAPEAHRCWREAHTRGAVRFIGLIPQSLLPKEILRLRRIDAVHDQYVGPPPEIGVVRKCCARLLSFPVRPALYIVRHGSALTSYPLLRAAARPNPSRVVVSAAPASAPAP